MCVCNCVVWSVVWFWLVSVCAVELVGEGVVVMVWWVGVWCIVWGVGG